MGRIQLNEREILLFQDSLTSLVNSGLYVHLAPEIAAVTEELNDSQGFVGAALGANLAYLLGQDLLHHKSTSSLITFDSLFLTYKRLSAEADPRWVSRLWLYATEGDDEDHLRKQEDHIIRRHPSLKYKFPETVTLTVVEKNALMQMLLSAINDDKFFLDKDKLRGLYEGFLNLTDKIILQYADAEALIRFILYYAKSECPSSQKIRWKSAFITELKNKLFSLQDTHRFKNGQLEPKIYVEFGNEALLFRNFKKAEDYFLKAKESLKEMPDREALMGMYLGLMTVYVEAKNYDEVIRLAGQALSELSNPEEENILFSKIIPSFAEALVKKEDYSQAAFFLILEGMLHEKKLEYVGNRFIEKAIQSYQKAISVLSVSFGGALISFLKKRVDQLKAAAQDQGILPSFNKGFDFYNFYKNFKSEMGMEQGRVKLFPTYTPCRYQSTPTDKLASLLLEKIQNPKAYRQGSNDSYFCANTEVAYYLFYKNLSASRPTLYVTLNKMDGGETRHFNRPANQVILDHVIPLMRALDDQPLKDQFSSIEVRFDETVVYIGRDLKGITFISSSGPSYKKANLLTIPDENLSMPFRYQWRHLLNFFGNDCWNSLYFENKQRNSKQDLSPRKASSWQEALIWAQDPKNILEIEDRGFEEIDLTSEHMPFSKKENSSLLPNEERWFHYYAFVNEVFGENCLRMAFSPKGTIFMVLPSKQIENYQYGLSFHFSENEAETSFQVGVYKTGVNFDQWYVEDRKERVEEVMNAFAPVLVQSKHPVMESLNSFSIASDCKAESVLWKRDVDRQFRGRNHVYTLPKVNAYNLSWSEGGNMRNFVRSFKVPFSR